MAKAFMNEPPAPKPEPHLVTLHLTKSEALAVRALVACTSPAFARSFVHGYPKGMAAIEMPTDALFKVYSALNGAMGEE